MTIMARSGRPCPNCCISLCYRLVTKVEISEDKSKVRILRAVEGATWVLETTLPALITTQKGLNEPRYASLPGIMKAKKKPLAAKKLADLGLDPNQVGEAGSKIKVLGLDPAAGTKSRPD